MGQKIKNEFSGVNLDQIDAAISKLCELGTSPTLIEDEVIVSLTSFPERINEVHYAIYSLLKQSVKPNKIILWLAEEEFNGKARDLPEALLNLTQYGLEIAWCSNIGSYKKLLPTLKLHPNAIIVTCDDDAFYANNWLETLLMSHRKHPDLVIAHRAHQIVFAGDMRLRPYEEWKRCISNIEPSYKNWFTGVGGVLYPPRCFSEVADVMQDEEIFRFLCPTADDTWFWTMSILNDKKIHVAKNNMSNITSINLQRALGNTSQFKLSDINVSGNQNIVQIDNALDFFEIRQKVFRDFY